MKKTLGRLGFVTAAAGLISAGLVGVGAPAASGTTETCARIGEADEKEFSQSPTSEARVEAKIRASQRYHADDGCGYDEFGAPKFSDPVNRGNGVWVVTASGTRTVILEDGGDEPPVLDEPMQKIPAPPPPCWSGEAGNNCPVGGALRFVAPKYAMVGVPVTMYAYVSWRSDANSPAQPTNGTAVIRVDGEDYSGVEFVDGVAQWRFIPETEGMKEFTASGVVSSGISGANAYIDSVPARTYVLEYDPAAYEEVLKKKRVEVGDTYVITDPNQARSYVKDRYGWLVSEKSDDVCAVYETKKGAVKAKFNGEGKCTVIWLDKESQDSGKYTFIARK